MTKGSGTGLGEPGAVVVVGSSEIDIDGSGDVRSTSPKEMAGALVEVVGLGVGECEVLRRLGARAVVESSGATYGGVELESTSSGLKLDERLGTFRAGVLRHGAERSAPRGDDGEVGRDVCSMGAGAVSERTSASLVRGRLEDVGAVVDRSSLREEVSSAEVVDMRPGSGDASCSRLLRRRATLSAIKLSSVMVLPSMTSSAGIGRSGRGFSRGGRPNSAR